LRFSLRALGLTVLATVVFVSPVFAQGLSVESKSPPSVVGAGPFVSLEGRFSIALPPGIHGFRPLSLDTPAGRLTGDAYNWTMKEGRYTAGFVNGTQSMENAEATATIFGNIRQGMTAWATSKNGKLIGERSVELDKHPGLEVKLEFPEAILWQRFYVVSSRLFQIVLVVSTDQRPYEAEAVKVLDSFKVLSEAEVAAAVKAKESAAEPSPLPQEPVAARDGSDAADDRLRGAVKTVLQESESLSEIQKIYGRYNDHLPCEYRYMDDAYESLYKSEKRVEVLSGFFAVVVIVISCLGLFGLASFVAEQRTKEIGIRKVMGASVAALWQMLSKDFVALVIIACFIAMPLGYYLMNSWLDMDSISPSDIEIFPILGC